MATAAIVGVLDKMVECSICLCQFVLPKVFPCQHTYCKACITSLVKNNKITCPACRRVYELDENGIDSFPPNVTISELIDLQEAVMAKVVTSSDSDGLSPEEIKRKMTNLEKGIDVLKAMKEVVDEKDLEKKKQSAQRQISSVFSKYRELLTTRESQLTAKVENIAEKALADHCTWQNAIDSKLAEATELLQDLHQEQTEGPGLEKSVLQLRRSNSIPHDILGVMELQPTSTSFHFTYGSQALATQLSDLGTVTVHRQMARQINRRLSHISPNPTLTTLSIDYYPNTKPLHTSKGIPEDKPFFPFEVAVAPNGNIVVSDIENHRVYIFDDQLMLMHGFGELGEAEGQLNRPTGVTVSNGGSVVVADQLNNRLVVYSLEGQFQYTFGKKGNQIGQLIYPCGLACDRRDNVYVCDSGNFRIQVFKLDGTPLYAFGDRDHLVYPPWFVAVTPDRRVLISDTKQYIRVFKLPKSKRLPTDQRSHGEEHQTRSGASADVKDPEKCSQITTVSKELYKIYMSHPTGVAVDPRGYLVVGHSAGHVVVLRDTGEVVCKIGTWGRAPGQFILPRGIAVTDQGYLVIADSSNHMVQLFQVNTI